LKIGGIFSLLLVLFYASIIILAVKYLNKEKRKREERRKRGGYMKCEKPADFDSTGSHHYHNYVSPLGAAYPATDSLGFDKFT